MEPITPQEGCQGHMVRECGMGDITVDIFGNYNQPQATRPIKRLMPVHSSRRLLLLTESLHMWPERISGGLTIL